MGLKKYFEELVVDKFVSDEVVVNGSIEADKAKTRGGYDDVTSSRSFDTKETNDSGADLDVCAVALADTGGINMTIDIQVDDMKVDADKTESTTGKDRVSVSATVPDGADYEVRSFGDTSDYELDSWVEQS